MGEVGGRVVNTRSRAMVLGAAVLMFGCGKVKDDISSGGTPPCEGSRACGPSDDSGAGGHAPIGSGAATNAGGSRGGSGGAVGGVTGGVAGRRNGEAGSAGSGEAGGTSAGSDGGELACPGTQVRVGGDCVTLGTVAPCAKMPSSGFPGDSQCIEAPPPVLGMQLHFGPSDYTDPDQVAKFLLQPGETDVRCMFMKTPNAAAVHVKEWHARVRPGAYEAMLFEKKAPLPDSTGPDTCSTGDTGDALVSVAGSDLDLSFDGGAPEFAGAGMNIGAHTQVAFLVNMSNATDEPLLVEAWLNGLYAKEPVAMEVAPTTWMGGLGMRVSPHTNQVVRSGASNVPMSSCVASADMNLIALVGSTGSHTTHMAAYVDRAGSTDRTKIYESFDWSSRARLYYDSVVRNPFPDPGTLTPGGPSGILALHPGDAISWECAIENTSDSTLTFSENPFTGELCNFYGVYGAGTKAWQCYF